MNNLEISQGRRTFGLVKNLIKLTENFCYPGFLVKYFCQRKRGRGVRQMSTPVNKGEGAQWAGKELYFMIRIFPDFL